MATSIKPRGAVLTEVDYQTAPSTGRRAAKKSEFDSSSLSDLPKGAFRHRLGRKTFCPMWLRVEARRESCGSAPTGQKIPKNKNSTQRQIVSDHRLIAMAAAKRNDRLWHKKCTIV
jgi:hypothetical protein